MLYHIVVRHTGYGWRHCQSDQWAVFPRRLGAALIQRTTSDVLHRNGKFGRGDEPQNSSGDVELFFIRVFMRSTLVREEFYSIFFIFSNTLLVGLANNRSG